MLHREIYYTLYVCVQTHSKTYLHEGTYIELMWKAGEVRAFKQGEEIGKFWQKLSLSTCTDTVIARTFIREEPTGHISCERCKKCLSNCGCTGRVCTC